MNLLFKIAKTMFQYFAVALAMIWLLLSLGCSSEEAEPAPIQAQQETQVGTGCQAIISKNVHSSGVPLKIKAEFLGCHDDVAFEVKSDLSSYRQGATCDATEKAISFAYTGTVLKVGLYPCGSEPASAGASYTLTIENSGVVTTIKAKVGNVNLYTVK
jgi:hypothetical protein